MIQQNIQERLVIRTEDEYLRALARLDELIGAPEFGPLADEYEIIADALCRYDRPLHTEDDVDTPVPQAPRISSPPEPVCARVRRSCCWVAENARHIHIRPEAIYAFVETGITTPAARLEHTPEHHLLGQGADTVGYFIILDSINYGSGYFSNLQKLPSLSGYYTIATLLKERCVQSGVPSALELTKVTPEWCGNVFRQDLSVPDMKELMTCYAASLHELGVYLLRRFGGSYTRMVEAAKGDANRMLQILTSLTGFQDVQLYRGRHIAFYKRAQIAVHDLAIAFNNDGWGAFEGINGLTAFADNVLPHVLRLEGVLEYDADLAQRIDAGVPLPHGCDQEVELRACSVHAVSLLTEALRARGGDVHDRELDYILWNRGHTGAFQESRRHVTKSTSY